MREYKPFSNISGADFLICNNNFYDLFDILQSFKEKLEEIEEEIAELDEQLKNIEVIPQNFAKRVKTKVKLLTKRMQLQYYNNIFIYKFLKKENEIIQEQEQNLEKEELEELLKLQTKVINKFKQLFLFFKEKQEKDKKIEEYLQDKL